VSSTKPSKGSKPYTIQWTRKDSIAAQKQGWDLFDAGARFEIEVNTEHPAGFGEGAYDDAVAWVIQQALRGNKTCIKGLIIAGLLDPQWFASDLTHAVKTGRITVMDTKKRKSKPYSTVEYRSDADPRPEDLEARVEKLEAAIRISIDHDASGHANWDGEGDSYIDQNGHKLLKETLEAI
jgi:hypothetical protein